MARLKDYNPDPSAPMQATTLELPSKAIEEAAELHSLAVNLANRARDLRSRLTGSGEADTLPSKLDTRCGGIIGELQNLHMRTAMELSDCLSYLATIEEVI